MNMRMDNGVVVCPSCGGLNLHHGAVEHFHRYYEDDPKGTNICVENGVIQTFVNADMSGSPSSRRSGMRIDMECEACGELSHDLAIYQHKGVTIIEWVPCQYV